jgi:hypothetical protein
MDAFGYRIVSEDAFAEKFQLHVLARAYRDAWLELKGQLPFGRHRLEDIGVTIEFERPG